MRIILDGMGGDNAPGEIVKGAAIASKLVKHEICIVGDEERIKKELSKNDHEPKNISVLHASDLITGEDRPVKAIRDKKESSLVKGLMMVKRGEGDMLLSAGNSGAVMTGGLLLLGRIGNIDRPALGSVYPFILKGAAGLLIDAGANSECRPNSLLYFAAMGKLYAEKVLGCPNPTVGLVNMGTEPGKGSTTLKETYRLLSEAKKQKGMNFIGNIEGRDVPTGIADVIVCDGMTGNVILKLTEGLGMSIMGLMSRQFTSSTSAKIGAALLLPKLKEMKAAFNYNEYGGAPILGIKAPVIKIHGSSNHGAVVSTILKAVPYVEENVIGEIEKAAAEMDELLGQSPETPFDKDCAII
ncbi:MAG: phosphate acyltransferase PlsX [Clostridiales Family XIII bacterium]|jgi:glycerol-3-phosphate acyltransferase PlsX|nr:phosphate acyltransferase PlsX [Clostridiales Family XIII bacterium]